MDIARALVKRGRKQLLYSALVVAAIVLATLGLHGLKPAAPRVDRAAIWIDSVQRGPLVIEVVVPGRWCPSGSATSPRSPPDGWSDGWPRRARR